MSFSAPNRKAVILLEDGTHFTGLASGKIGTCMGELCFNTGMTGYQEVFTDPSYFGQILIMTNDHIGNYGTSSAEVESDSVKIAGLVTRKFNTLYSRQKADTDIQEYCEQNNLVGITEVDTRALVSHIRNKGAMNAIISSEDVSLDELKMRLSNFPSMAGLELSSKVSTENTYELLVDNAEYKIAVLDLGVKKNILRCFNERKCNLKVFPAKTSYAEMKEYGADGYFISNGPGDPAVTSYAVETVKEILSHNQPLFGICLGHQMLALANGIDTYKMHNGHRGLNHPVINLKTQKSEITSQNHGFAVNASQLKNNQDIEVTHVNLNDDTIEGIAMKNKPAFSVQYHPESSPGPHDSRYLFDDFLNLINQHKQN